MAKVVNLFMKVNGAAVAGEPETVGHNGVLADSIECLTYVDAVRTARELGSARATGERRYAPIRIRKRVDKSTPVIQQALTRNEVVECRFEFRRPSPLGDGKVQHYFTVELTGGRIDSIKRRNPDTFDPAASREPFTEWVSIVFNHITMTHETGSTSASDSWVHGTMG